MFWLRPINAPIKKSDRIAINRAMRKMETRCIWMETINKDMLMRRAIEEIALNRVEWKKKLKVEWEKRKEFM